jgi:hypothetical protein
VEEIKYIIKESEGNTISLNAILAILKKRILVFTVVFIAVVAATGIWVLAQKPYYNAKISVGSAYFTGNAIEPMITAIAEVRRDRNYEELAALLKITQVEAESILKVEIRNKSTVKDFYSVDIVLKVSNPQTIPAIANGFMQYFDNSPYVSNKVGIMKKELEGFTQNGETELVRLDSLKKSLSVILSDKSKTASNIIFPSNIHLEAVNINEKVYQARQDLKLLKGVELLSKPTIPNMPANPSAAMLIIAGIAAAFFVAALAALTVEYATK